MIENPENPVMAGIRAADAIHSNSRGGSVKFDCREAADYFKARLCERFPPIAYGTGVDIREVEDAQVVADYRIYSAD